MTITGLVTGRATVRMDEDKRMRITTAFKGEQRSVFYTPEEVDALILALQHARLSPLTTFAVDWGKDN